MYIEIQSILPVCTYQATQHKPQTVRPLVITWIHRQEYTTICAMLWSASITTVTIKLKDSSPFHLECQKVYYFEKKISSAITVYHRVLVEKFRRKSIFQIGGSTYRQMIAMTACWFEWESPLRHLQCDVYWTYRRVQRLISIAIEASLRSTGAYSFDLSSILYNTKDELP